MKKSFLGVVKNKVKHGIRYKITDENFLKKMSGGE